MSAHAQTGTASKTGRQATGRSLEGAKIHADALHDALLAMQAVMDQLYSNLSESRQTAHMALLNAAILLGRSVMDQHNYLDLELELLAGRTPKH